MAELADREQSADQFLDMAKQQMLAGEIDSAHNTVRAVISLTPAKARAWYLMGKILSEQPGNRAEAADAYKRALTLDPDLDVARDGMEALSGRNTLAPQEPQGRDSWFDQPDAIDPSPGQGGPEDGLKADAISRARTAESSYNWVVARTAWEEVLAQDPEDTWAWAQYAHLLSVNMHLFDAAEAAYRRGLRSDPTDDWLWAKLGIMLADFCGRVEEGQELLRKAVALDSRECYYHGWLGWSLYRQSENYAEAADHLARAVELWPEYQWAWFHLGFVRMSLGDRPKEAETALKRALELDAEDVVSIYNLACLYEEQFGDAARGYRTYLKAHRKVPDDVGIIRKLGMLALGPLGDVEKAEEWFRRILEFEDQDIEALVRLGGIAWDEKGEVGEGIGLLERATSLALGNAWAWTQLGLAHWRGRQDPQEARSCFSQAVLADPDYAWAHACLGDLLMEQGAARADIVSSYLNATEAAPDEAWNWLQLGRAYEMEPQDYKSALQAYELYFERAHDKQAALIHPLSVSLIHLKDMEKSLYWASMLDEETCDDPFLLIMVGRVRRLAEGNMEAAEALFRKALLMSPEEHYAWHELGELKLYDLGDGESAAECLKTAMKYDAECSSIAADLSVVLWAEGRQAEALQMAEEGAQENPDEAQAWTALAMLKYLSGEALEDCLILAEKAIAMDSQHKNARLVHLALLELADPGSPATERARVEAIAVMPDWLDVEQAAFRYLNPLGTATPDDT